MALFANIPSKKPAAPKKEKSGSEIKLKKGETISSLIETAKKLVEEKLGNYKDASKCITNLDDLKTFLWVNVSDIAEENGKIAAEFILNNLQFIGLYDPKTTKLY